MPHQHAPRGRIKAPLAHPTDGATTRIAKCRATAKGTGERCKRYPIPGGAVCVKHGGGAPQVRAAAERRLEELRPAAIRYYDYLLEQREYPSAGLGAANAVMDRVDGRPAERVDMRVTGEVSLVAKIAAARQRLIAQKP